MLPRVVELFEARKPRETAVISEIDGVVKHGGIVKGQRKIIIVPEDGGEPREYSLPRGVHVNVQESDRVRAGEPLMDGPSNPHDILSVLGEKALHAYLVNEIQEVYRLQGVNINDKHIEVIVRQMMRWVKIEAKMGHLRGTLHVRASGMEPAAKRWRNEGSLAGCRGPRHLRKMGRLIPAGTGFDYYRHVRIPADEPPPPPPPIPEELELEREMEYFVEPEEAFTRDEIE